MAVTVETRDVADGAGYLLVQRELSDGPQDRQVMGIRPGGGGASSGAPSTVVPVNSVFPTRPVGPLVHVAVI